MIKKKNLFRIIWIIGVYAILISVLYLVVIYKVEWEDKDLSKYLYFYDCNNYLCTSEIEQDDYISKVKCEDDVCPYIVDKIDEHVILFDDNNSWLYDYQNDKILNNEYNNYRYVGYDNYVATNAEGKQGVINSSGDIIINFNYEYIKSYHNKYVVYRENDLYGIFNDDKLIDIECQYKDVVFINDSLFGYMMGNKYYIRYYDSIGNTGNEYDYLYAYDDIILVVSDKKIDILSSKLSSVLLMKVDTYYEYTTEKERDSLNIYSDDNYLYFSVYLGNNEFKNYKYDLVGNKLIG